VVLEQSSIGTSPVEHNPLIIQTSFLFRKRYNMTAYSTPCTITPNNNFKNNNNNTTTYLLTYFTLGRCRLNPIAILHLPLPGS